MEELIQAEHECVLHEVDTAQGMLMPSQAGIHHHNGTCALNFCQSIPKKDLNCHVDQANTLEDRLRMTFSRDIFKPN